MKRKIFATHVLILLIFTSVTYSQTKGGPIEVLLNYKNDGVKLKQIFSEENQLDEYHFEVAENLLKSASGNNIFHQFENKKYKKSKLKDITQFFDYLDREFNKLNYVKLFKNEEDRIITYRKNNNYRKSYLEFYYEDDQLSLMEITQMKEYGIDEFKNVDSIYRVNSAKIDFVDVELDKDVFEEMIAKSTHRNLKAAATNFSSKDSVIANYDIEFAAGKITFESGSMDQILSLVSTIRNMPNRKFIVVGNTSSAGARSSNYILSRNRAEFICKVLVTYFDIDQTKLLFKGNGEDFPLYDNNSEDNRSKNRRIDLLDFINFNSN